VHTSTLLGPETFRSMPWRNGLGTTVELLKQDLPGEGLRRDLSVASNGAETSNSTVKRGKMFHRYIVNPNPNYSPDCAPTVKLR